MKKETNMDGFFWKQIQTDFFLFSQQKIMGNTQSEFEQQFHKLYWFVGMGEDRVLGPAKIYRRRQFNFDYVMVIERPLSDFAPLQQPYPNDLVQNTLELIRKYQNAFTVTILSSRIVQTRTVGCDQAIVRLFLQYYNHSLHDYLSALRASRLHLTLEELIFVAASLVEAMLALKKMQITDFRLCLRNVLVSADQGKVVVNPAYLIYQAAVAGNNSTKVKRISSDYQPLDLAESTSLSLRKPLSLFQLQLDNILSIIMEMAGYLTHEQLPAAQQLWITLRQCNSVEQLLLRLGGGSHELNVDQFGQLHDHIRLYPMSGE